MCGVQASKAEMYTRVYIRTLFPTRSASKFANVHKVFGASNVAKLLNEINAANREDAVNSLAYEAEARLHDPVYGCVGMISILQQQLKHLQNDLLAAKKELAAYIGPSAMAHVGYMPQQYMSDPSSSSVIPYNMSPILGLPPGAPHDGQLIIREPQTQQTQQNQHQLQQILEAQQLAAAMAARGQEIMRTHERQQQEQELLRFDNGFDADGIVGAASSFNQMTAAAMSPSRALGTFGHQLQLQPQPQPQPSCFLKPKNNLSYLNSSKDLEARTPETWAHLVKSCSSFL
ncbi:LOB domain-containing protein 10 [Vitis vinifera]|uniref:LOB domain-containing protein 10 n=1 Tax=Vitis vinifera TaxID=29760 RepID=A0A438EE85_VITVI|nr:LOB domain-containing protein 10 [Vitis vinifera]